MAEIDKTTPRVVEAEVVRDDAPHTHVEQVDVKRVPGGFFVGRSAFSFGGDPAKAASRLKELRLKLTLYALGLMAISIGCFVGAFLTDVVIFAAFLLVAGLLVGCAAGFVYLLLRTVRALSRTH